MAKKESKKEESLFAKVPRGETPLPDNRRPLDTDKIKK